MLPDNPNALDGGVDVEHEKIKDWFQIKKYLQSLYKTLTTNLDFGQYSFVNSKYYPGNVQGQMILVNFAAANVEKDIKHLLNRVPQGYLVFQSNVACNVYQMYNTGTPWTATDIYLKSSAISNVLLFVF